MGDGFFDTAANNDRSEFSVTRLFGMAATGKLSGNGLAGSPAISLPGSEELLIKGGVATGGLPDLNEGRLSAYAEVEWEREFSIRSGRILEVDAETGVTAGAVSSLYSSAAVEYYHQTDSGSWLVANASTGVSHDLDSIGSPELAGSLGGGWIYEGDGSSAVRYAEVLTEAAVSSDDMKAWVRGEVETGVVPENERLYAKFGAAAGISERSGEYAQTYAGIGYRTPLLIGKTLLQAEVEAGPVISIGGEQGINNGGGLHDIAYTGGNGLGAFANFVVKF